MLRGGGRVLLCAQRLYYRRDQLDCPPPNGLNHYLSLNKTGARSTGERFRATMALLFSFLDSLSKLSSFSKEIENTCIFSSPEPLAQGELL